MGPLKLLLSAGDILKNVEVSGGTPASLCPLGNSCSFTLFIFFGGVGGVSIKAGPRLARGHCHPAPTALSVPREDEQPPGAPGRGRGRERAERGACQRGERGGRVPGSGPRSHAVMLFLGCRPAPGRGLLRQHPCPPPQEPGKDRQELAVRTGDSDRTEEGESPTRVPGWVPSWWGLKRLVTSVGCWGLMGFGSLCGDPGTGLGDMKPCWCWGKDRDVLMLGQEGRGRRKSRPKAFMSGVSSGVTASLQMQKPWRSRC